MKQKQETSTEAVLTAVLTDTELSNSFGRNSFISQDAECSTAGFVAVARDSTPIHIDL